MSGLIGEILGRFTGGTAGAGGSGQDVLGALLGGGAGSAPGQGATTQGSVPQGGSAGLGGLVQQLMQGGLGQEVQSWIGHGSNLPVSAEQLGQVLSNQQVQSMAERFGVPMQQVLPMLSQVLPHAVDQATPDGQVPQGGQGQGGQAGQSTSQDPFA